MEAASLAVGHATDDAVYVFLDPVHEALGMEGVLAGSDDYAFLVYEFYETY